MNINATLLIQMINFGIAYIFLRFILFKPVVKLIDNDALKLQILHNHIVEQKKNIGLLKKEQEERLDECKIYCKNNAPLVVVQPITKEFNQDTVFSFSFDDDELVRAVYAVLKERLKNVN